MYRYLRFKSSRFLSIKQYHSIAYLVLLIFFRLFIFLRSKLNMCRIQEEEDNLRSPAGDNTHAGG